MSDRPESKPLSPADAEAYEQRFTHTPDPFAEITRLQQGSDRSFASTVQQIVRSAEPAQRPKLEARLLQSFNDPVCSDAGRFFICRMLALIGSAAAVPVLAPLLRRAETIDMARYALDGIPDPAVDEAYRAALGEVRGLARAGLIESLALRADPASLPALRAVRDDRDELPLVREGAARACERLNEKR